MTSSGQIQSVAVNDQVFLVEELQYGVTKVFRQDGNVQQQKINCRDRPSKRSVKQK